MFRTLDADAVADIARQSDPQALTQALADAGFISEDCARQIQADLTPIFQLLRSVNRPSEANWERFQSFWGFAKQRSDRRYTPMNAANLCPRAEPFVKAVNQLRVEYNLNVAQQTRTEGGRRVTELRKARRLVALGLGLPADSNDVVLVRNASEGNNLIHRGYVGWRETDKIEDKDNVVLWTQNHPTNRTAWEMRADWGNSPEPKPPTSRSRFVVRPVTPDFGEGATPRSIAQTFLDAVDGNTRFLTFSETSNSNGQRIPEEAIRLIWQEVTTKYPNCHVHIDGTMTWGARQVNLSEGKRMCHSFTSSAHKWFLGPKETGILYMSKDKVRNFMPSIFAYDYKIAVPENWRDIPDDAMRFQLLGQRDDVNVIALAYAQALWNHLLRWKPYERVVHLASCLKSKAEDANFKIESPRSSDFSSGVVWIEAPRRDRQGKSLFEFLYENKVFKVGAGGGGDRLRLCPHVYNTEKDIHWVVETMKAWPNRGK